MLLCSISVINLFQCSKIFWSNFYDNLFGEWNMLYVAKINSFLCKIQYKVRSWLWLWLPQFSNLLSCSIQHFRPLWAHFIFRLEEVSMSHLPYFFINKLNSINRTLWSLVPVVFPWRNIFKIFIFSNYQWITSWK